MGEKAIKTKRMLRPEGTRALRSSEALKEALLTLVELRPLEQISIRDITTQAGVSYPVFFRRYQTKEQLLEDIAASEVDALLRISFPMFRREAAIDSLQAVCDYVQSHRSLWRRLLNGGAAPAMRDQFLRRAEEMGRNYEYWVPIDLISRVVVGTLFEVLSWWLSQADDYPVEKVIKLLDVLVVRASSRPHGFTLD